MTIFSRSKKGKPSTATLSQIPPAPILNAQSNHQEHYAILPQPNWTYGEQRPNTSAGYQYGPGPAQGWTITPPPQYAQFDLAPAPQHYLTPPPFLQRPQATVAVINNLNFDSVRNLLAGDVPDCIPGARIFNGEVAALTQQYQAAALCNLISSKFDAVITLIDGERFSGHERDLVLHEPPQPLWQQEQRQTGYANQDLMKGKAKGVVNTKISSALVSTNYFAKVNLYANSRLPPNLPPMKLYVPTFPLLCLAAQYSERVYTRPLGQERETHVDSDWRTGTKAMVIKSVPMDDINTIVFAIRGSQTFMDWAVNLDSEPASPNGFLDDPGNYCHAGFLTAARKMIKPVAARLRHLLEEDPSRSRYSLLITGHSAGGAVAALLYSHMLSTSREAESELSVLSGCFKRIHCVSFGSPPISLLPLTKPSDYRYRKSLFLSFINEGDPIARADRAYIRSLLNLYTSPAPGQSCLESATPQILQPLISNRSGKSSSSVTVNKIRPSLKKSKTAPSPSSAPLWPVPDATLSNAGRLVLLRSVERYERQPKKKTPIQERMNDGVVAQIVTDELLRTVIWGDPVCHMMRLYVRRIEILATNAVTGRG